MGIDRFAALAAQRQEVLDYCADLTDADWATPSRAAGWRVQDVIAHFAAETKVLFGPKIVGVMTSKDIEAKNEDVLESWRDFTPDRVVDEFARWSSRLITLAKLSTRGPLGAIPLPLANLGTYPARLLPSVFVFDWHTHLAHDIAPAIGRPVPPVDDVRMAAILEWLLAGVEQMNRDTMAWLDQPIALTLAGPAGGAWQIAPGRGGKLAVTPGRGDTPIARIAGDAVEFPAWSTTRTNWRDHDLTIVGDRDYATRFLDSLNLI